MQVCCRVHPPSPLLLLVFCCSSRSMTPITETHHRHHQLVSLLFHIPRICCSSAVVSFSLSYVSQSSCLLEHLAITHRVGEHAQAICVFVDLSCYDTAILLDSIQNFRVADFCCPADPLHLSPYPHFKSFDPFHICFRYCPCLCCIQGHTPYQTFNDSFP